jgi:hypothetical protein
VSPMAAKSDLWKNHPPVWMVTGFEMLTDSNLISTQRIAASGTYTELVGYEGMPHCFAMVFPTSPAGKDCYQRWATFCSDAVGGKLKQGPKKASWAKAKSNPLHFEEVAVEKLTELTEEEVDRALEEAKAKATKKEAKAIEEWKAKGQSTTAKSVSMSEASTADVSAAVASRAKL